MILPIILFLPAWILWFIIRYMFFMWRKHDGSKQSFVACQDSNVEENSNNAIRASLVDLVTLKRETGVIGFFYVFTHGFAGALVAVPAYKGKWFQDNGRLYGNNELSLACGTVALSIITAVMLRSLLKTNSWLQLKPIYTYAAPIGSILATAHVVLMGYKGWDGLFKYSVKNGQPSITWTSTMFAIGVITVNTLLNIFGTNKRIGRHFIIWRHSLTNFALTKYLLIKKNVDDGLFVVSEKVDSCSAMSSSSSFSDNPMEA